MAANEKTFFLGAPITGITVQSSQASTQAMIYLFLMTLDEVTFLYE